MYEILRRSYEGFFTGQVSRAGLVITANDAQTERYVAQIWFSFSLITPTHAQVLHIYQFSIYYSERFWMNEPIGTDFFA